MTPLARYVVETVIALMAIVALSILLLSVLRRSGFGKSSGPLELVARLPLEGRRAVYLVRVGSTVYVLGASDQAMLKLGELSEAEVPRALAEPKSFSAVLKQAIGVRPAPVSSAPKPEEPS